MSDQNKREAFEKHLTRSHYGAFLDKNEDGSYKVFDVNNRWKTWCEALKAADEELNAVHRQLAAEKLRADTMTERLEMRNRTVRELESKLMHRLQNQLNCKWKFFEDHQPIEGQRILWRHDGTIGVCEYRKDAINWLGEWVSQAELIVSW